MLLKRSIWAAAIAAATVLTACGGGGGSTVTGGASSNLYSNDISIGTTTLVAGQSTAILAHAMMRGATPNSMTWTATPLGAVNPSDPGIIIGDLSCSSATFVKPAVTGATGEGTCSTIVTAPAGARNGRWRITNTAKADTAGAISSFVDVDLIALPEAGFALIESSTPATGYINKPLTLSVPFTVAAGAAVRDVQYKWTAAGQNPAILPIAGSRNSTATVTPIVAGQYSFDVEVSALVNGFTKTLNGSVVAIVNPANFVDAIDAGLPRIVAPGDIVSLSGSILNRSDTLVYSTSWRQLDGVAGGPARVDLTNQNSSVSSFVAPMTTGTYGFEYKVVKNQADGTQAVTTANTTVIVKPVVTGVFTVAAGDAQNVATGTVALLRGSVGVQGNASGVTYSYSWAQVGATPAAVTLANAATATASFVPTVAGTYTFNLTVTATTASGSTTVTGTTQVVATTTATPTPTTAFAMSASAGAAQSVAVNSVTTLTGAQTTQGTATGVTYAYQWSQIGTTPAVVTLSNPTSATATFFPTVSGTYGFRLTVTATLVDGSTRTATSDTQVIVGGTGNTFSVSAGDAQVIAVNNAATMAGVVSTQGSFTNAAFSYSWAQVGATPAVVTVSNATALSASFVATVAGPYTFELTVTSTQGGVTTTRTAQTQVLVTP